MKNDLVIHRIFSKVVSSYGDSVALQIKAGPEWQKIKYDELDALSRKVAVILTKEGLRKGDFVALISENRPEWPVAYLGIMYAGLSCVPLDSQLSPQEIKNLILDSTAKIIFCSGNVFTQKFKDNLDEYSSKFYVFDGACAFDLKVKDFSRIKEAPDVDYSLVAVEADDIASLIYTSGTTALPKGVLLSHGNICSNFESIKELNIYYPSDNVLSILPLYHTYSFMVTLIMPLFTGAKITYCPSLKSSELALVIKEAKVTILAAVPQLVALLHKAMYERVKKIPLIFRPLCLPLIRVKLRKAFGHLRFLACGGARLEPDINRDMAHLGLKVIEGYGLTETSPVVTFNPLEKVKFGSAGRAIPGVEIKIENPDKTGTGEVLIRGANVMQGYFKHPELTAQVIKDGWFHSGDLGWIDPDGYLFLTGRKKDVIVLSSGKNIYPEELEEYYAKSPYIKEICVMARKEEKFGRQIELLYALVVPDLEYFRQKKEADIRGKLLWELENLAGKLPPYKHIMGFTISKDELPRTALKKIKRYEINNIYFKGEPKEANQGNKGLSAADKELLSYEVAQKIIKYIASELKIPISLDSHLEIDLGIDSLSRVELYLGLEALLHIKIPEESIYTASTVREAIISIKNLMEGQNATEYRPEGAPGEWSRILMQADKEEIEKNVRIKINLWDKLFTFIYQNILLLIFRIFWQLKIRGKENLPKDGPYLICPNHASYLDGFVVFSSLPLRNAINLFSLGNSKILEHPSVKWALKGCRLIPVDPNLNLVAALQYVAFVLRNGKIAVIFPEGRRAVDENVGEFKKGVGILIKELDIPVIPVYIRGSHQSWPRGRRFPRFCRIEIIFGKPLTTQVTDDYGSIVQKLKEEVLKLQ